MQTRLKWLTLLGTLLLASIGRAQEATPRVEIRFSKSVLATPFTGRVFLILSKKEIKDGPFAQSWLNPEPFFAQIVKAWQPEQPLAFEPNEAFPMPLAKVAARKYWVQAILDRDLGSLNVLGSAGNLYSKGKAIDWPSAQTITLLVDQTIPAKKFEESATRKLVEIESKLLSKFHGKPIFLRAGVLLPKSYAKATDRRYPAIYEIPGFSGDHFHISRAEARKATEVAGTEMIHVTLDPSCRRGHHVFADSQNNGPYGRALVEELIPYIEKSFRTWAEPRGRLLTGHSSGGWSSLWLQITYPEFFGGTWSTAPDPVDFRDFQKVDIYQPGVNLFVDEKGEERPLGRKAGKVTLRYRPFSDMEVVFGRGGQLFSFEAVFSPKGKDGEPMPLWDRKTGAIDPRVAEAWKKYDIRLVMEKNCKTLGPKIAGKIHVYMGAEDTYFLDGATRLLKQSLHDLGSDAVVEIFPGKDHSTLMDDAMRQRIAREMAQSVQEPRTK